MKKAKALVIVAACLAGLGLLWNSFGAEALLAPDAAAFTPSADDRSLSHAGIKDWADAPWAYSLLAHLQEARPEPTNTPASPEVTNTPARPGPEPTNTPAAPESQSIRTYERAPARLRTPEGIKQSEVGLSVAEQRVQDEQHVRAELERAEQLRRAGVRFQVIQPETRRPPGNRRQSTAALGTSANPPVPAVGAWGPFSGVKGHPKLESSLAQLLEVRRREGLNGAKTFASQHRMVLEDSRVQVVIEASGETIDDLKEAVGALGGEYQTRYEALLQALLPIDALESLAGRPDVRIVREPRRPMPAAPLRAGTVDTEGLGPSNALAWHTAGYTGSGVRIAVIDLGFDGYASLLGTDLPPSVNTYDWGGGGMGGSGHGTACAEIVHDMAPGAAMDLHRITSLVELGNAVDRAIADGVDVISMSLLWFLDGPGDGTGPLADIVSRARSNGIFYAVVSGNNAEHSWSGTYNESGFESHLWASGQDVNYFGPGDGGAYFIPVGFPIDVFLHWDDWTAVNQDYDMLLLYWDGGSWQLVEGSYNDQSGGYPWPVESISIQAPFETHYGVVVLRRSATRDVCLRLSASHAGADLDERVPERSLMFPGDSPDAITVGSVDVSSPYPLEPYSSRGPTFGPGGTCTGGSTKPDIVAYDNVSTVSYGPEEFGGASAAVPHVAGAAALVKEAYPGYSVSQLQSYLESNAVDLGGPGKDNLYGSGRLRLPQINNSPYEPSNPSPADGAINQGLNIDLSWSGGDPDSGDTVTYDVYFEANDSTPDNLVCNDVSTPTCDPGTLSASTRYYWYVVATDNHGASTTGKTWDFTTGAESNRPPNTPSNPSPADGAMHQGLNVDLSWTGGDPDSGDTVTYDVYFEANDSTPDQLLCNDVPTTYCDPGTLDTDRHYYWYVRATDNHGASTRGATWDFVTTAGGTEERCVNLVLNPQMDVVEFGDGTGSVEYWSILFQKIYYSTQDYQSSPYSLVMADETDGSDPDLVDIEGETWDYDEFGQGFQAPPNISYMRISYNRLYADANSNDGVWSNLWTLDSEGYLEDLVAYAPIGESPGGWSHRYWELDSSQLAAVSGRPLALVFDMLSDRTAPSEVVWLDDAQVHVCYTPNPPPIYLPITVKKFAPPTGPTPEPEPVCSPREPDSVSQRGSIDVGATCGGSFSPTDEKDYYSVNLEGASAVRLRLFNLPSGTNWDALIYEDAAGYPLRCQIGTPGDKDKETNCTLNPSRSYFVLVSRGPLSAGGSYNMSLTRQ